MSVFNGDKFRIEFFGQSHGDFISAKVYGLPKFDIDKNALSAFLERRKGKNAAYSTSRIEPDELIFNDLGGGGTEIKIANKNVRKTDYDNLYGKPRPSHADYCSYLKDGNVDFSGGGRFSGRLTALLCAVGGICLQYLSALNVKISAFVSQVGDIKALSYKDRELSCEEIEKLRQGDFPSLDKKQEVLSYIEKIRREGDSVGARVDVVVDGMIEGLGDSYFDGLEGKIASLVYAIPAVKGVEFGLGFDFAKNLGSRVNDQMTYENGKVKFLSNNCGGIYGGISCGGKMTMSVAFKPTPSILKGQKTVDLIEKKPCEITVHGRHDACIAPRAVPCVEAAVAIAILDEYLKNK